MGPCVTHRQWEHAHEQVCDPSPGGGEGVLSRACVPSSSWHGNARARPQQGLLCNRCSCLRERMWMAVTTGMDEPPYSCPRGTGTR